MARTESEQWPWLEAAFYVWRVPQPPLTAELCRRHVGGDEDLCRTIKRMEKFFFKGIQPMKTSCVVAAYDILQACNATHQTAYIPIPPLPPRSQKERGRWLQHVKDMDVNAALLIKTISVAGSLLGGAIPGWDDAAQTNFTARLQETKDVAVDCVEDLEASTDVRLLLNVVAATLQEKLPPTHSTES